MNHKFYVDFELLVYFDALFHYFSPCTRDLCVCTISLVFQKFQFYSNGEFKSEFFFIFIFLLFSKFYFYFFIYFYYFIFCQNFHDSRYAKIFIFQE